MDLPASTMRSSCCRFCLSVPTESVFEKSATTPYLLQIKAVHILCKLHVEAKPFGINLTTVQQFDIMDLFVIPAWRSEDSSGKSLFRKNVNCNG